MKSEHICCKIYGNVKAIYLCETFNEHSTPRTLHHYRCAECGTVSVGDDIQEKELAQAYSTLDSEKYYEEIEVETRRKTATAIEHLKSLISPSSRIIDIGAGNGLFARTLYESGYLNLSAHEIPGERLPEIAGINCKLYRDFDYTCIPAGSFDAVVLLDVMEHVLDPRYLLQSCNKILGENGVLYAHTPVVTRTDRMMHFIQKVPILQKVGRIWQRGRTSIFHLQNYTRESLTLLLEESGFKDIQIEIVNELSWPVMRYIKIYLIEKQGLPWFIAPFFYPLFYPVLATDFLNANKAIICARKA